jgi:hypothetical protein
MQLQQVLGTKNDHCAAAAMQWLYYNDSKTYSVLLHQGLSVLQAAALKR